MCDQFALYSISGCLQGRFVGVVAAVGILATAGTLLFAQAAPPASDQLKPKLPIPPQADQQEVLDTLAEIYDLGKKRTDQQKLELVKDLLRLVDETQKPTDRFVLWRKAMELAGDVGDAVLMCEVIDRIGAEYHIDPLSTQGKMLTSIAPKATTAGRIGSLVEASNRYIGRAAAQGKFDYAQNIAALAYRTSQNAQGKDFRKPTLDRCREVQKLADASAAVRANPADTDANLTLGRLYCLSQGDWHLGLPYLAKGGETELAAVARQELEAPADAAGQVKLADAWWSVAEAAKDNEKEPMMRRAGVWYKKAERGAIGLAKVKIEKRLAEIAKLDRPADAAATAATRPKEPAARVGWIDLLELVNIERDRVSGTWTKEGNSLAVANGGKLMLPVLVEGSYQLEVEFTRVRGDSDVNIILPVGSRQCMMMFSGWSGTASGLEMIDGSRASSNPTTVKPGTMTNGRRYRVWMPIVVGGEAAGLEVLVDGRSYTRWAGKQASLSMPPDWRLPCGKCPGLAAKSDVIFHSARLRINDGKAIPVTSAAMYQAHPAEEHPPGPTVSEREAAKAAKKAEAKKREEARRRVEAAKRAAEFKKRIEAKRRHKKIQAARPQGEVTHNCRTIPAHCGNSSVDPKGRGTVGSGQ